MEKLTKQHSKFEWMRRRASEIFVELFRYKYSSEQDDLDELKDTLLASLPPTDRHWNDRDIAIYRVANNPELLWYYNQHLKREADMLVLLHAEGSFTLPPREAVI